MKHAALAASLIAMLLTACGHKDEAPQTAAPAAAEQSAPAPAASEQAAAPAAAPAADNNANVGLKPVDAVPAPVNAEQKPEQK